jgi:hypothetical protein
MANEEQLAIDPHRPARRDTSPLRGRMGGGLSYFVFAIFLLLLQACGALPIRSPEVESTVTAVKQSRLISTSTATVTETIVPAQATLTEFARQAEGTRQALVETEVSMQQNADATATARALGATATALAPQPPVDVQIEVQADVIWQDTGINVRPGDTVKIQYVAGEWSIWVDTDPMTNGEGQSGRTEDCRLMPEANLGGLIGRVGDNQPFFIGNGAEVFSDFAGNLQLSMNDCPPFESNGGALTVHVIIDR